MAEIFEEEPSERQEEDVLSYRSPNVKTPKIFQELKSRQNYKKTNKSEIELKSADPKSKIQNNQNSELASESSNLTQEEAMAQIQYKAVNESKIEIKSGQNISI